MFQTKDLALGDVKYIARSRAVVVDNNDPAKRGRIRVNSPVLGETEWIDYLTAPNSFNVPDVGSIVYVECDGGYHTHPIAWGNVNYGEDNDLQFPTAFQRITPNNRGFYTPGGHLIEFDDGVGLTESGKGLRLTASGGNSISITEDLTDPVGRILLHGANGAGLTVKGTEDKIEIVASTGLNIVLDGPTDTVSIGTITGTNVKVEGSSDKITIAAAFGDNIEVSAANGIQMSTPANGGTSISMVGGVIDISGFAGGTFSSDIGFIELEAQGGSKLKLDNGKVGLGGPTAELLDLFDQELDSFINNAATLTLTVVGPGSLNPAVVTLLTNIKILLNTIKGGI